ncbi:MAG: ribokinase [Sphaerochaetaceae bacterium]|jgi:ribokinase|nr:ribokinase [Sphaerochaetaceae bacterium]
MKALVFGSMNVDLVFKVSSIVEEGQTISASSMAKNAGGKGANQAIALAQAGMKTYLAASIGPDGLFLEDMLKDKGVDASLVTHLDSPSGQAIIQVDSKGRNCIIVLSGANGNVSEALIDEKLSGFRKNDWLVLENEIPMIDAIAAKAKAKGMKVCLNPSPANEAARAVDPADVDLLIVNEAEAEFLAQKKDMDYPEILQCLGQIYETAEIVLTASSKGACSIDESGAFVMVSSPKVKVVDTTGAGDTFLGYYLCLRSEGSSIEESLEGACYAASLACTKMGAARSIPSRSELDF